MADYKRYCGECFLPVPPSWNQRYCPACGGKIKLRIVKKKPQTQGRPKNTTPEEPERRPRKLRATRKLTKQDTFSMFAAREKSVLGPRFFSMSPAALFILNVVSFGIRSALWIMSHMSSLIMMARPEEKNIKHSLRVWALSFCASFTLFALTAFDFILSGFAPLGSSGVIMLKSAGGAFLFSFLVSRHILFWCREVIVDELLKSDLDVIKSRAETFASSAILTWFVGAPYIQLHINRMIEKKGLSSYSSSGRAHMKRPRSEHGAAQIQKAGSESQEIAG
ncbi:MAG: hypothetical protein LBT23_05470 [Synergistaceae bacterium]|jgi:hypothetical protein|nr:hypothetical protein [Synergistaceae bacterium]